MRDASTFGAALLLLACGETTVVMPPVSEPVEAPRPSRATPATPPRPSSTAIASATPAAAPPPAPPPPPGEALSESDVEDFVLDDAGIFVVGKTSVRLVPKGGGKTRALATGLRSPRGIAVDGTRVYWADGGTARGRYADGAIMSLSKGGGAPVVVAVQEGPSGIIVDDTTLYWMSRGIINSCQKQACRPSAAVTGASDRVGFLIDDAYLYWVSKDRVFRTPKAGGPPTQLAQFTISSASPSDGIDGMAIDDSFVYVFGSDVIERIPKTGGPPHRVVDDVYTAGAIAVDGTSIYWVQKGTELVFKAPKAGGRHTSLSTPGFEGIVHSRRIRTDASQVYVSLFKQMGFAGFTSTDLFTINK